MKRIAYLLLPALCLSLAACGPREPAPGASSSGPEVSASQPETSSSQPGASSRPEVTAPDPGASDPGTSIPDASIPDTSQAEPLPPLTEADKAAAYDAACDYYLGTVFEVDSLTETGTKSGEITFQVSCSKGGVPVDPDRTISLERKNDTWTVVSEGY